MKYVISCIFFILLTAFSLLAQAPPQPSDFWGTIKIGGSDAPVGTTITPTINNIEYQTPFTITEALGPGFYGLLSVNGDIESTIDVKEGGVNGDIIVFKAKVNNDEYILYPNGTWQGGTTQVLNLSDQHPIPVELSSFRVGTNCHSVELNWTTESESNNFGFEIQRSEDSITFQRIGFRPGRGTTSSPHNYQFVDINLPSDKYYYRLKQIDTDGSATFSATIFVSLSKPNDYQLQQNYPNPFNPTTTILFSIATDERVVLSIYNVSGRLIATLIDNLLTAGTHACEWDGKDTNGNSAANGLYICHLSAGEFSETKKMLLAE